MVISLPFVMNNKARDRSYGYKKSVHDYFTASILLHFSVNLRINGIHSRFFSKIKNFPKLL
jgi:hypothetical protein